MKKTLREYWNENEVTQLFWASTGKPTGQHLELNLDDEGEDYCDLNEVVDSMCVDFETGESDWWEAQGEIQPDNSWEWDGLPVGLRDLTDMNGNNLTILRVW